MEKLANDSDFGVKLLEILGLNEKRNVTSLNFSVLPQDIVKVTCTFALFQEDGDKFLEELKKYKLTLTKVETNI